MPAATARQQETSLLRALFSARGERIPRTDLARSAGISEGDLELRLAPYLESGYPVEFHPQGTVQLHEPPDIWCAEELLARCAMPEGGLRWDPLLLATTASTNDVARNQGRKGAREGFLVAASGQTAGRGRLGRTWESPPERGLYVSFLLRPVLAPLEVGRLAVLASVAAVDAIEAVSGVRPQIKWPNDIVLGGRKLAGLLIEAGQKAGALDFAVVGLGVNVRHSETDFSPELRPTATSLYRALHHLYRRADVLVALLDAFNRRWTQPFAEARDAWTASSLTLGQRVELVTARGRRQGQAMGLDDSGALLLRVPSGEIETITAGDMHVQ